MFPYNTPAQGLTAIALAAMLLLSPVAHADLRLNLVATVDNQPVMKDVTWTVYRTDTDAQVTSARNHSTHVTLPPGSYRVEATLVADNKTIKRTRNLQLRTSDSSVVVSMD